MMFCSFTVSCKHHLKDHNESEHEYKKQLLYATHITIWIELEKKKAKKGIKQKQSLPSVMMPNLCSLAWCKRQKKAAQAGLSSDTYSLCGNCLCHVTPPFLIPSIGKIEEQSPKTSPNSTHDYQLD